MRIQLLHGHETRTCVTFGDLKKPGEGLGGHILAQGPPYSRPGTLPRGTQLSPRDPPSFFLTTLNIFFIFILFFFIFRNYPEGARNDPEGARNDSEGGQYDS